MSDEAGYPCNPANPPHVHRPHFWCHDLGDEEFECWGYPLPEQKPDFEAMWRAQNPDEEED